MGDSVIFNRRITGAFKSVWMYVAIAFCMGFGGALMNLTKDSWEKMWGAQRVGWALLATGGVLTTMKAATSKSTRKADDA
jgi:hypothetical protein